MAYARAERRARRRRRQLWLGIVLVLSGSTLLWWLRPDGRLLHTVPLTEGMSMIAFRPDGQVVAVGRAPSALALVRVADGQVLATSAPAPQIAQDIVEDLVFSADGRRLFSVDQAGQLLEWDGTSLALRRRIAQTPFPGQGGRWLCHRPEAVRIDTRTEPLASVAVSPDGQTVAVGSEWGCVYFFDLATGTRTQMVALYPEPVAFIPIISNIVFSRDSQMLRIGTTMYRRSDGRLLTLTEAPETGAGENAHFLRLHLPPHITLVSDWTPDGQTMSLVDGIFYRYNFVHWRNSAITTSIVESTDGRWVP